MQTTHESTSTTLTTLNTEKSALEEQAAALKVKHQAAENQIKSLQADLETSTAKHAALEEQHNEMQTTHESSIQTLTTVQADKIALEEQNQLSEVRVETMKKQQDKLTKEKKDLEAGHEKILVSHAGALKAMQEESAALSASFISEKSVLETVVSDLQKTHEQVQKEKEKLLEHIQSLKKNVLEEQHKFEHLQHNHQEKIDLQLMQHQATMLELTSQHQEAVEEAVQQAQEQENNNIQERIMHAKEEATEEAINTATAEMTEDLTLMTNDRDEWKEKHDVYLRKEEAEESLDEPTLNRQVALLEKELKQVHGDAAGLAERTNTMERRCMEAEMKWKDAVRAQDKTQKEFIQLQRDRSEASSPRLRTPSLVVGDDIIMLPVSSTPTLLSKSGGAGGSGGKTPRSRSGNKRNGNDHNDDSASSKDQNISTPIARSSPAQKYQAARATIAKLNTTIKNLNKKMLTLDVENQEWKLKESEQRRVVERMLKDTSSSNNLLSSPAASSGKQQQQSKKQSIHQIVENQPSVDLLKREMLRREHESELEKMRLQAHLLRVRGRVHVKVRIRPPNDEERRSEYGIVGEAVGAKELAFMDPRSDRWRPFAFDGVHGVNASQKEVFGDLASMSSLVVDGYCCGVMAYGQTGSGKTHTMQGTTSNPGINQQTLRKVFETVRRREANPLNQHNYTVVLSMMEIYNEEVIDLLPPDLNSNDGDKIGAEDAVAKRLRRGSSGWGSTGQRAMRSAHAKISSQQQQQQRSSNGRIAKIAARQGGKLEVSCRVEGGGKSSSSGGGNSSGGSGGGSGSGSNQPRVVVRGLTSCPVSNEREANALFERGMNQRAVASTDVHQHSSRSHCIVRIDVHGVPRKKDGDGDEKEEEDEEEEKEEKRGKAEIKEMEKKRLSTRAGKSKETKHDSLAKIKKKHQVTTVEETFGRLYLVDLAGSERVNKSGVKGQQLTEAKNINRSLSALGDVIEALDKKRAHVPYRNSTLTRLLQDALCARSIVAMIVTVCPTESTAEESMSSLYFAQRLRSIEMGVAQKKIAIKNNQDENTVLQVCR